MRSAEKPARIKRINQRRRKGWRGIRVESWGGGESRRGMIEGDTRRMQLISRSVFHAGLIGFDRAASSRKVSNGTRRHNSFMFVMGCHGVRYNLAETAIVGDPPKPSKYRRPFRSLLPPPPPVRFVTRSLLSSFFPLSFSPFLPTHRFPSSLPLISNSRFRLSVYRKPAGKK